MSLHRIIRDEIPERGEVVIAGDEAHHALRVKRLESGDTVELLDGRGTVASAVVRAADKAGREWRLRAEVTRRECRPRVVPAVHVLAAAPKGDRLHDMIAGLSQVGAASWAPFVSERTVVEPREAKMDRLRHVAMESMKQCGRAWALDILPPVRISEIGGRPGVIVAEASGDGFRGVVGETATIVVGPEGGLTAAEVRALREAGARVASFGRHTMRTEVAAVVAAGIVACASR